MTFYTARMTLLYTVYFANGLKSGSNWNLMIMSTPILAIASFMIVREGQWQWAKNIILWLVSKGLALPTAMAMTSQSHLRLLLRISQQLLTQWIKSFTVAWSAAFSTLLRGHVLTSHLQSPNFHALFLIQANRISRQQNESSDILKRL